MESVRKDKDNKFVKTERRRNYLESYYKFLTEYLLAINFLDSAKLKTVWIKITRTYVS